jgi:fatty acid desaturase
VKVDAPGVSVVAIVVAVIGLLALLGGAIFFGLFALVIGSLWAYTTARKRQLKLMAGGGEVLAMETSDAQLAEQVRSAIAEAIAVR